MSREFNRDMERQQRRQEQDGGVSPTVSQDQKGRTGPGQFLREVRGELKRVNWPNRTEVTSYSTVVLVAVSILTLYIFGLDQAFGQFVLWIFG